MSDVGDLLVRMVVSLGVVLGVVGVGYTIARRRAGVGGGRFSAMTSPRSRRSSRSSRNSQGAQLEIEARAGLSRGSSAVALRFADRVVLVCLTDGAPATVLAEVAAADWDAEPEADLDSDPVDDGVAVSPTSAASRATRTPLDPNGVVSERPSFLDALRDATSRRP